MSWRRVPPVFSPIEPRAVAGAAAAALGLRTPSRETIERELRSRFEAREIVLTDSGTSALVLALEATVTPGSIVAMPGYACIDLIAAAIRARVKVALYDVDPETLSPDLDSVRGVLASGAQALLIAPLYGYPVDMTSLEATATAHGVPLIEDAAQAAGATLSGKRVGAFGETSVLSFGRGKGTTGGSGGALLLRGRDWSATADAMRAKLRERRRGVKDTVALAAQWMFARPSLYAIPSAVPMLKLGEMVYHPAGEPRALSAAASAVVPAALAIDAAEVRARRARAEGLMTACAESGRFTPIRPLDGARPGYLRLAIRDLTGHADPDPQGGVIRGYPITLDEHAETRRILHRDTRLIGARELRDRLFTIPTHTRVGPADDARLRAWVASPALDGAPAVVHSGT